MLIMAEIACQNQKEHRAGAWKFMMPMTTLHLLIVVQNIAIRP
jgi:hypothetical protein